MIIFVIEKKIVGKLIYSAIFGWYNVGLFDALLISDWKVNSGKYWEVNWKCAMVHWFRLRFRLASILQVQLEFLNYSALVRSLSGTTIQFWTKVQSFNLRFTPKQTNPWIVAQTKILLWGELVRVSCLTANFQTFQTILWGVTMGVGREAVESSPDAHGVGLEINWEKIKNNDRIKAKDKQYYLSLCFIFEKNNWLKLGRKRKAMIKYSTIGNLLQSGWLTLNIVGQERFLTRRRPCKQSYGDLLILCSRTVETWRQSVVVACLTKPLVVFPLELIIITFVQ